jgi:hypothetical protein
VRFGPWSPIEGAREAAPAQPGVLQARSDALLELPRGKSAMILYAASADDEPLADFVQRGGAGPLAAAARLGARWVRFAATARPGEALARLLRQFEERFGAPPRAHQTEAEPHGHADRRDQGDDD